MAPTRLSMSTIFIQAIKLAPREGINLVFTSKFDLSDIAKKDSTDLSVLYQFISRTKLKFAEKSNQVMIYKLFLY